MKDEDLELHEEAHARFNEAWEAVDEDRRECVEDRRFYSIAGAQWEGSWGLQFENKPRLELNHIHLSVLRIINEYRNNRS